MKDISLVNLTLLAKWKWRFLNEREAIQMNFMEFRYNNLMGVIFNQSSVKSLKKVSIWWRYLMLIGKEEVNSSDWFV